MPNSDYRALIETELTSLLPQGSLRSVARLNEAIRYAIFPGGKRMRPILTLMGANIAGCDLQRALPAACANEFLHASSLILDDLPAMDDADVRRGRPALHLIFGEDLALLSALSLLNEAYAIFGRYPRLISEAAGCIGVDGMIGGQAIDLDTRAVGERGRNRKTTSLMRLTLSAGAIACGAPAHQVEALAHCGECLGEAYQIYDDLLDECARCEDTGKTARQDARHHRLSYSIEYGIDASRANVAALVAESKKTLYDCFGKSEAVDTLARCIDAIVGEVKTAGLVTA